MRRYAGVARDLRARLVPLAIDDTSATLYLVARGELVPAGRVGELLALHGVKGVPQLGARGAVSAPEPRPHFPDTRGSADDLARILKLPWGSRGDADLDRFRVVGGTMRLRKVQAEALAQTEAGGLLGAVPVGQGKTLIALLVPRVLHATRPLLLVPAALREQCARDVERYGAHFDLPQVTIRSYEELSTPGRSGMLTILVPDLIVADECHKLRYFSSARVRRVARYLRDHPECRFVGLSGTITRGSIKDFAHLTAWALGERSPLPLGQALLGAWADALDEADFVPRVLAPICRRTAEVAPRKAVQAHLAGSPGIILTSGEEADCSLLLVERHLAPPVDVQRLSQQVVDTWQAPNGDELESPIARDRVLGQLACGFYYYWDWSPDPWSGHPDEPWLLARAAWHKAVRTTLQSDFAVEGLDSPMLLAAACARGRDVPSALAAAWHGWLPHRAKDPPPTLAAWVDPFRVNDAIAWARAQEDPPLLWYAHRAVGAELALRSGFSRYGEAEGASRGLLGHGSPLPLAVSVQAHGQGKNLQVWGNQVVVAPVRSATAWQQLLGRTHRLGQARDEVSATIYVDGAFGTALAAAAEDAREIEETTGQAQRLVYASRGSGSG